MPAGTLLTLAVTLLQPEAAGNILNRSKQKSEETRQEGVPIVRPPSCNYF